MKKIIQIGTLLVLLAAFSAVAAHAQNTSRIDAKIPFNFNVGDKAYQAGDYVIKTLELSDSTERVSLLGSDGKILQSFLVYSNGDLAAGDERLVFDVRGDSHYLTKIQTNDKGLLLPKAEPKKLQLAKRF